ncbi:hypothetical protein SNEBB_003202 [Seison nebaliae]|nr:hypothetical protein SNEBB_003202 [Seison nebaliae]
MFFEICYWIFLLTQYSSATSLASAIARGLSSNDISCTNCVVMLSANVDIVKLRQFVNDDHQICDVKQKAFKRSNDFGFTCIREGDVFIIYQNVILGRSITEKGPSLPDRWETNDGHDIDEPVGTISLNFSRRYKSQLLSMPFANFEYIQLDFHKNDHVMARFIFENNKEESDNTRWFRIQHIKYAIGPFAPGCEPYDLGAIHSTHYNEEHLFDNGKRPLSFITNCVTCDTDSIVISIVSTTGACYYRHNEYDPRPYEADYILYSCGPIYSTRDQVQIADDVTFVALY